MEEKSETTEFIGCELGVASVEMRNEAMEPDEIPRGVKKTEKTELRACQYLKGRKMGRIQQENGDQPRRRQVGRVRV